MTKKKKRSPPPAPTLPPVAQLSLPAPPMEAGEALRALVLDTALLRRAVFWAVALAFLWSVREVWVPLLFVGVLTFLGDPLVQRLERRRVPRPAGAAIVVVGGLLVLVALLSLVVPALLSDLSALVQRLPDILGRAVAAMEQRFGVQVPSQLKDLPTAASAELLDALRPLATGGAMAKTVSTTVSTGVGILKGAASTLGVVAQATLVPVLGFFVLAELPEVKKLAHSFVPKGSRGLVAFYLPRLDDALSRLVRGQIIVAGVMTLLYIVGLSIAGVPLALAIAILAGAAYLVPFASATVCLVLSVAVSLLELGSAAGAPVIGALIVCVVVQLIEGYVLTPRIVGEQAGLSPLAALLAVLFGGAAGGFLGVLFALPIGCVLALILREEAARRAAALESA